MSLHSSLATIHRFNNIFFPRCFLHVVENSGVFTKFDYVFLVRYGYNYGSEGTLDIATSSFLGVFLALTGDVVH